jgi:peptide/nickel transport system substrate-binding protein
VLPVRPSAGPSSMPRRVAGRRWAAALVSALLLPGLSGCQGAPPEQPPAGDRAPGFDVGMGAPRSPSARVGGTLRLVSGNVDSYDPTRSYQLGLWDVMRLYTRQLVTYPAAPGAAGTRTVPDLAAAPGKVTDGGRTWTYTLKAGVKFETGQPITATDVKYGIERSFATNVLVGGPSWLVQLLDDPKLPYPGPYQDTDLYKKGLPSVTTPNPRTIVFHLNRPFGDFDKVLAMPAASPVPKARDTRNEYGDRPVSSGPYRFGGRASAPAGKLVLIRNPSWSRATDPVRKALPDQIELQAGLSPAQRDAKVLAGQADLDVTGAGLQPESAARALSDPRLAGRVDNPSNGDLHLVAMPVTVPPLDNVHCRRAVQYAVDKAAVKTALGGDFAASMSTTLWPRELPGYPASAPYPAGPDNHGDLDRARAELKACGRPAGFSTRIATVDVGRGLVVARQLSTALARVGIKAEVRPFPDEVFLQSAAGAPKAITDGGYGLVSVSWVTDFPSPVAFYPPLVDGRSRRTVGNTDYAQLSDVPLQARCDAAAAILDASAATAGWRGVDAVTMTLAAYLPVVEDKAVLLTSARVRNAYVHLAWRNYDLAAIGVG